MLPGIKKLHMDAGGLDSRAVKFPTLLSAKTLPVWNACCSKRKKVFYKGFWLIVYMKRFRHINPDSQFDDKKENPKPLYPYTR